MNLNQMKASDVAFTLVVISLFRLLWVLIKGVFLVGWSIAVGLIETAYQERSALMEILDSFFELIKTGFEILTEMFRVIVKKS